MIGQDLQWGCLIGNEIMINFINVSVNLNIFYVGLRVTLINIRVSPFPTT